MKCIHNVLQQTYSPIEHIVIDDCSEDETGSLPIFHLPKQVGAAKTRNIGVSRSKGKYLTFIDDDDILYPNHCEELWNAIGPDHFVYGIADKYQDGKSIGQWIPGPKTDITIRNHIPICTVLISREAWDKVGGMDESLKFYQDWDLWLRLIKAGYTPRHVPVCTSKIFYYDNTITSNRSPEDTVEVKKKIIDNFRKK